MWGCANPFAPTGGPKDTTPPVAIVAPSDTILNYKGGNLVWAFNENIQRAKEENIKISPKAEFVLKQKGRSFVLTLSNMQDEISYNVGLKDVIRDFNEGNVYPEQSIWISSLDSLAEGNLSYDVFTVFQDKNLEELRGEIVCLNPPLTYTLMEKDRFVGNLENVQGHHEYYYRVYRDLNMNNTLDSNEYFWEDTLNVGLPNNLIIEGPGPVNIKLDTLSKGWHMIYPKPDPMEWKKIKELNGFVFSTYTWGDDTIYASSSGELLKGKTDALNFTSKVLSCWGSFNSDSVCAVWSNQDSVSSHRDFFRGCFPKDYQIETQDEGRIKPFNEGLYYCKFLLESLEGKLLSAPKVIKVNAENGDLLWAGPYKEDEIYSFNLKPHFVQVFTGDPTDNVVYCVSGLDAKRNFLLHTTLQKRKKIFIND